MAPPSVTVAPNPHTTSNEFLTLTGGPFGASQGSSFVRMVDGDGIIYEIVVTAWGNTSITVEFPLDSVRLATQTCLWAVIVSNEAGKTTSVYEGVRPASAELEVGDPVYVAATEIRAEQQSASRGYVRGDNPLQIEMLQVDGTFAQATVVDPDIVRPMGSMSLDYLIKQDRLPPFVPGPPPPAPEPTNTNLVSDQNPAVVGDTVEFEATVTSTGTPTGNVEFSVDGVVVQTVALVAGVATYQTSSLTVGARLIEADYLGDGTYAASSDSLTQNITAAAQNTATAVATDPNPSDTGEAVDITATVTAGVGTPTGNVNFFFDGNPYDSNPVALVGGVATIANYTDLPNGTIAITANYLGGVGFNASNSPTHNHVVNLVNQNTTTVVTSTVNPANINQATDITATVTAGVGTPTGNVNFTIDGVPYVGNPVALVAGVATLTGYTFPTGGTKPITADYLGGVGFNTSSSTTYNQGVRFNTSTVTTTVANPSEANDGYDVIATVTSSGGTPTGNVYFGVDGSTFPFGPFGLVAGVATWSIPDNTGGTAPGDVIPYYGQYQGSSTFNFSTSAQHVHTVKQLPGIQINATPTPTTGNDAPDGYSVQFTATFTANSPAVTGTVTFVNITTTENYGTFAISGGSASVTTASFMAGPNTIKATYNGDANYSVEDVDFVNYEIGTMDTTSTLSYIITPNGPNYDIHVTLTVQTGNTVVPTGNADLLFDNVSQGVASLDGSGQAEWDIINFNSGSYDFRGDYLGNVDFNASFDEDLNKSIP